jgi:hypothetical protein
MPALQLRFKFCDENILKMPPHIKHKLKTGLKILVFLIFQHNN